jgi:small subunit ribosomal protein S18
MIKKKKIFKKQTPADNVVLRIIDYKNGAFLQQLISEQGKILSRKINRFTAKQQRASTRAIKIARTFAILHFSRNEI